MTKIKEMVLPGHQCAVCGGDGQKEVFSFTEQQTATFECDICHGSGRLYTRWALAYVLLVGLFLGLAPLGVLLVNGWLIP